MKRLALLCLSWCLLTAASQPPKSTAIASIGGLTAVHREFESPESRVLRLRCPPTEEFPVEDAVTVPEIAAVIDVSPNAERESFIPLGDFLASLQTFFDEIKAPEVIVSQPSPSFLELHQKFLKERCDELSDKHPFLYHVCSTRLQELKTLLNILGSLYQSIPEDIGERCAQLSALFSEARSLVKAAFHAQTKYLDSTYRSLHESSQAALKSFEDTTPEALKQFWLFETALESIDMDIKMHCYWPYLNLDLWLETRTVIFEFIYLSIF